MALNACADTGGRVRVRDGVIIAEWKQAGGYVLVGGKRGRWRAASLTYDPAVTSAGEDD